MPSKQRTKSQKGGQKPKGKGSAAVAEPEESGTEFNPNAETLAVETPDLGTAEVVDRAATTVEAVSTSTTPEFGEARIVESPTAESPVAIAVTTADGEPKIKSAAQKKWREKNRPKVQEYQKKWREAHKDKVKEIHANYRKKNPEKVKAWQKASQDRRKAKAAAEKEAASTTASQSTS